jgi:hypothetical protein
MKPHSPHAINQFVDGNQTIQLYLKLSDDYQHRRYAPRMDKYFKFILDGRSEELTVLGNFIYGAARRYLERYLNGQKEDFYVHPEFTVSSPQCELELNLYTIVHIGLTGVWCKIEHCPFWKLKDAYYPRFRINTHKPLDETEVLNITKAAVESWLYPQGFLRDIQIHHQCPKSEVKHLYQLFYRYTQTMREALGYDTEVCYKAILRRLRRKYNINLVHGDFYNMGIDYRHAILLPHFGKLTTVDARPWHITYNDIEEWCLGEGKEVDEDTILEAFDAILDE